MPNTVFTITEMWTEYENFLTYILCTLPELYSEFANPIEIGNEISADQKSIILKLAEHIFGRFGIKYINLIVFTATQSCSFRKFCNMSLTHLSLV